MEIALVIIVSAFSVLMAVMFVISDARADRYRKESADRLNDSNFKLVHWALRELTTSATLQYSTTREFQDDDERQRSYIRWEGYCKGLRDLEQIVESKWEGKKDGKS